MTFASLPTKYVLDLKVVVCYLAIHRREFVVFNLVLKKKQLWWHLVLLQSHTMMVSPLASAWFTSITHAYVDNICPYTTLYTIESA
jgi:hypothetical protein